MRINVGSPYNCLKIALRYALGSITRPTLININDAYVTFRNDTEEIIFEFPPLNYEYANRIALEDIPSFGQEEYGKFLYEYGRVLFANLIVAITRLDWHAVGSAAHNELKFVSEYYDELLKLNSKAPEVLAAFEDTIQLKREPNVPRYNLFYAAFEIINIKQNNGFSNEAPEIKNDYILALAYTALWFSIVGYLLLFCQKTDVDGLSRLLVSADNKNEAKVLIKSIADSQEKEENIINICSLIFAYFHINRFYLISSGLTIQDPFLELLGKFSVHLMALIKDETDLIIIDTDLIHGVTETGPSLVSFTDKYDPLADVSRFINTGIIKGDNTNIFSFGKSYIAMYIKTIGDDAIPLTNFIEPCINKYIEKNVSINSYGNSDNIEIEKSFVYLKNIINGLEKEKIGAVCPGTILQLTLIASTYRLIETSSTFSRLSDKKKLLVQVGIDMIDILIVLLYQLWFLSGKFFIQPSRPRYRGTSALDTLELLREEVLIILEEYFEFVKYGKKPQEPLFRDTMKQRILKRDILTTQEIVNRFNPISNQSAYISECGKHGIYTIAYSALCNNINPQFTIPFLADWASHTPLDATIIRQLSNYVEGTDFAYTDVPIIDAMFKAYRVASKHLDEKPEYFMITVYALLFETMEQLLIKNSVGNYFDFNNAENLTTSYHVETIVSEMIKKPLQVNLGSQNAQQKLLAEQEREALR
jgi:hypothetical protein